MISVRLFLAVLLMCGCAAGCASPPSDAGPPPPPPEPEAVAASPADVQSLSELADEYEQLDRQQADTNRQMAELLARYQRRGGALPPGFGPDLTDEQREVLAERIRTERAGLRSLLEDIAARDRELADLKSRQSELAGRLPESVVAREGDRHDRIAMDFLMRQGVSANQAYEIVSKLSLTDALLPGFRVWTYYRDGQFGTWVSQGNASLSPQEHQKRLLAVLNEERDSAVAALGRTRADLADSRQIAKRSEEALSTATAELAALTAAAARQQAEGDRLAAEATRIRQTLRYVVGTKKGLTAERIVDRQLRLTSVESPASRAAELTGPITIAIDGTAHGLKRIRRLTLVPQVFTPGVDHRVVFDGAFARLEILDPAKFQSVSFLVIVLE